VCLDIQAFVYRDRVDHYISSLTRNSRHSTKKEEKEGEKRQSNGQQRTMLTETEEKNPV
jgi:hypothetical protein